MTYACLLMRSASRPRTRIIRLLCSFTTPFESNFTSFPLGLRTITKTHPIRKAFLQKPSINRALRSFGAISNWQPGAAKNPNCHGQTSWVRSGRDKGLLTIDIPAIVPIRRKKIRSIRLAKNQPLGLRAGGYYRADDYLRARRQSLSTNNSENPHRKSTNSK